MTRNINPVRVIWQKGKHNLSENRLIEIGIKSTKEKNDIKFHKHNFRTMFGLMRSPEFNRRTHTQEKGMR